MKRIPIAQVVWVAASAAAHAQHQTSVLDEPIVDGTLPYTIDITEVSLAPATLPNIHSVAAGIWEDQWVLLAGRTNGLHGLTGNNAFDPAFENRDVWVIDPLTKRSWHKSLETSPASGLSQDVIDSLSSVNTEFYQDGATLLVVGGYGYQRSASDHVTYGRLTAIDLPGIVAWVKAAPETETTQATDHIQQIVDNYFQVTGGGLERIGDEYQLVFGQNYDGRYRPNRSGVYTERVRRFRVDLAAGPLSVPATSKLQTAQNDAFRRRDLNIATMLEPGGQPGAAAEAVAALSGVFTPSNGAFTVPVIIREGGDVQMPDPLAPATLQQAFQIYHCAKAGLYQSTTGEMHFLLFGGITVLEFDLSSSTWTRDDNAPFSNQCGVVVHHADGHFEQHFIPARFPTILSSGKELRFGANAEFFPAPNAPMLHRRVLDLAAISEPAVIGHIFGGLVSDAGNGGNSGSSGRVFEVTLTPIPPEAPRLNITATVNAAQLEWVGENGQSYVVEASDNLAHWSAASVPLIGDGSQISWPVDSLTERRFYRVATGLNSTP